MAVTSKKIVKKDAKVVIHTNELGKMPPQAVELEEALLGALMISPEKLDDEVGDMLKPDSFYKETHQKIYQAMLNLLNKQQPVDVYTLTEELRRMGELENIGGVSYLAMLSQKVASAAHLASHVRIIAQKAIARQLISISTVTINDAYEEAIDVEEVMQHAEAQLFELAAGQTKKVVRVNAVLNEAINRINKAQQKTGNVTGLSCGFRDIDELTGGWQNSDLIIIAARPAMGKTAFVLSMAKNIAVDMHIPIAMFSLEMSNIQLVNRLIMSVCEISGDKLRTGNLDKKEWERLHDNMSKLEQAPFYIDDTPGLSILELRSKARRLVREQHVRAIFIDYLQLMNASGMNFYSREQEVSLISRSLKGLAKELDIPIIALSQLNRNLEGRGAAKGDKNEAKKPQLSDLRESGAIEQDADIVCFIHRPEYYKIYDDEQGKDLRGIAQIIFAKHRNGATGDVDLKFIAQYAQFASLNVDLSAVPTGQQTKDFPSRFNNTTVSAISNSHYNTSRDKDSESVPF